MKEIWKKQNLRTNVQIWIPIKNSVEEFVLVASSYYVAVALLINIVSVDRQLR